MLPSGSWLHITVGFLLGISSTVFIYITRGLIQQYSAIGKIVLCLAIYVSTIVLVMYLYGAGLYGGLLTEWKSLGRPAFGDRAMKLLDLGYVLAQSGNRYQFLHRNDRDGAWEVVQEMVNENILPLTLPMKDCETLFFLPLLKGNVVDSKAACFSTGHSTVKVVYTIDNDGGVHLWEHGSGGVYQKFMDKFVMPLTTGVVSCIFGIVAILFLAAFSGLLTRGKNSR